MTELEMRDVTVKDLSWSEDSDFQVRDSIYFKPQEGSNKLTFLSNGAANKTGEFPSVDFKVKLHINNEEKTWSVTSKLLLQKLARVGREHARGLIGLRFDILRVGTGLRTAYSLKEIQG